MDINELNEMSRIIDFNYDDANNKIHKILDKEDVDGFTMQSKSLDLYQCFGGKTSTSGLFWYVIFNDLKTDIDFLVKFKQHSVIFNGKKYNTMVPYHTYKKNNSTRTKSIVKKVYSYINKEFNRPIMSDKKQSIKMIEIWLKWFENKSKYGVKDFKFIDEKSQKILSLEDLSELDFGFHNAFEVNERYRMIVDFHHIIKEATSIVLENKSYGKFFGKQGRDWVCKGK